MKGFYRLYFVAVDYLILDLCAAEISVFEGMLVEARVTEVWRDEMVTLCAAEYFTLFAPCLPLT